MTSASVLSSDHTNSKSRGLLDAAVNSNEVSQNTAAVPSSSSLSMSSSKDFHSSTLAISSSPFEVLSAGMANKQTIAPLTLVSSELVTSSVLVSTLVVPSSALSRSYSSSVATMSSNLITEQGTSALPSSGVSQSYYSPSVPHLVLFLFLPTLASFFFESGIILIILNTYSPSIYIACSLSQYGNPEGDIRSSYQSLLSKALPF